MKGAMMVKTREEKAKGRTISALRIGLRNAEARFERIGDAKAAKECRIALDRADRMERDG